MLRDLVFPQTDAGVATQLVVLSATTAAALWLVRRERSLVLLVAGLAVTTLGLLGLRAVH